MLIKLAGKLKGELGLLFKQKLKEGYKPYKAIMLAREEFKQLEPEIIKSVKAAVQTPIQQPLFDIEPYSILKTNKRWRR